MKISHLKLGQIKVSYKLVQKERKNIDNEVYKKCALHASQNSHGREIKYSDFKELIN